MRALCNETFDTDSNPPAGPPQVIANVLPVSAIPEMSSTPKSVSPPVRIFVSTWNMGNDDWGENFDEWIPNDGSLDLIVIGTQESKLGAGDKTGQMGNGARDWFKALSKAIGDDYVAVVRPALSRTSRATVTVCPSLPGGRARPHSIRLPAVGPAG